MFISRFAPSPTGFLHLGHAYSALLTYDLVKKNSGNLILRIEDIDITRCNFDFENQIYEDLKWLGIKWDETPLRQSERLSIYTYNLSILEQKNLVYGCNCSRSDIKKALSAPNNLFNNSKIHVYPGTCRDKKLPINKHNVRLNLTKSKNYLKNQHLNFFEQGNGPNGEKGYQYFSIDWIMKNHGDFIIARKDIKTSYHLSVTVDDASQNITHISRGNDLFYVTPIQILLQKLLNLTTPLYVHHNLIKDENENKLAKTKGAESLLNLKKSGKSLKQILTTLGL